MQDRSVAIFVVGFLLAAYLFTYTGVIQSSDGLAMFATAESIVRRGQIDMNQLLWMDLQQGSFGPDGELYSRKGLGMTLLALPLVWMAKQWPAVGLAQAALLLNPLLMAWTGAILYRCGRRLEWSRSAAVATALSFGLATMTWPYTQTFFSDPVCGWGLFTAFYGLLGFAQTGQKRYLLIGGIAWGLAYLTRVLNLVTLPIYLVGLLVVLHRQFEQRYQRVASSNSLALFSPKTLPKILSTQWRPLASFLIPIVLAGLTSLWWNWLRYGSIWESGYVETERFELFGISGLLMGPARGLLWYSPILILGLWGANWFWHNQRWILGAILALSALYVGVYGKWYMWHGGFSWGPRFLVPLMPFLALLTGPVWAWWLDSQRGGWHMLGRIVVLLLLLLSIAVQWLGLLIPFGWVQNWLASEIQPLFASETFIQLDYSPLLRQWDFISPEHIHLTWWKLGELRGGVDWLGIAMPLSGILVGLLLVLRQTRLIQRTTRSEESGDVDNPRNWLYSVALYLIALAVLTYYSTTLRDSQNYSVAEQIAAREQPDDAILHLYPEQTQHFANLYHGNLPTYGFFADEALDEKSAAWLNQLRQRYRRLWVVSTHETFDQSGWERPLRTNEFLLLERRPSQQHLDQPTQRLALYAVAGMSQLQESGLGTIFGDPALIESSKVTADNGWMRLAGYGLTPSSGANGEILLALRWQSLRPVDYNYHVFVHLLDIDGQKVAQRDGQPVQWQRPTSTWQPSEEILDQYGLLLPPDLLAGEYTIVVGLYDPVNGQRLPVSAGTRDYAIQLGPVYVTR